MEILFGPRKKENCFSNCACGLQRNWLWLKLSISISATSFILHKAIKGSSLKARDGIVSEERRSRVVLLVWACSFLLWLFGLLIKYFIFLSNV